EGEGTGIKILTALGVHLDELRREIENSIRPMAKHAVNLSNIPLVKQAEKALKVTYLEAKIFSSPVIGTEHLLLAILKDEDALVTRLLKNRNIDYNVVKEEIEYMSSSN